MQRIKVILVDDHDLFLNGLKVSLSSHAFIEVVATFNEAKKALNFLKKQSVNLVITDISMPEINGVEFIKKLRQLTPQIKVLAISMFPPLHFEKDFYNGYLIKDASIETVTKAIKSIVYKNTPFFYDDISNSETLNFSKSIVTKREREIINLITQEFTVDEIAECLFLSKHTVETHKKNIFFKLQVKTNAGLVKKAIQLGFV